MKSIEVYTNADSTTISPYIAIDDCVNYQEASHVFKCMQCDLQFRIDIARAIASKFTNDHDKPFHNDEAFQCSTYRRPLQAAPKIRRDCPADIAAVSRHEPHMIDEAVIRIWFDPGSMLQPEK